MIIFVHHFTIGAGAAAAFEALKLWEMRGKFTEAKFRRLMRSTVLWIPLIMMLAASGFFAWAYYESEPGASAWNLAIAGIAARALLRQSSASLLANQRVKLGTPSVASDEIRLRDVFL